MFVPPKQAHNTQQGCYINQLLQQIIKNPLVGTPIEHWQSQFVEIENFNAHGVPHYLSKESGEFSTGLRFVANPANPLRGVVCRAPWRPVQAVDGIHYTAQFELYLPIDLGEVFKLDDRLPKRQDRFVINGVDYYAIAPSLPCMAGETIGCWKIELNRGKYPVSPDGQIN